MTADRTMRPTSATQWTTVSPSSFKLSNIRRLCVTAWRSLPWTSNPLRLDQS